MRLYLAHPFDSRHETREIELGVESRLGVELFNPFYDAADRTDVELIDAGRAERYEKLEPKELVERDLRGIRESDGLLGLVTGHLSYGTLMEIVYAHRMGKPVFLIVTNGHQDHPWLRYHATSIFTSWRQFVDFFRENPDANT